MKKFYGWLLRTIPRPWLIRLSYVFRLFAPLFLKGNKVECTVCKKHYRKFLPYGTHQRDNVLCPNCLTLERHRLLWLYLNEKTDFFTAKHEVLHIAPEQCFYKRFRSMSNLRYVTADLESPLADVHMDMHHMPFKNEEFDIVFANHVLEHVDDPHQCMTEVLRVLKPGGWAIMQVPIDYSREKTYEDRSITSPADREKHFWQKDHLRLFGRDYPERLRKAGFSVDENNFSAALPDDVRERYRLQKEEVLYICKKIT
ncbi:MAG: class I SAM-dependent methyltransferase [Flavobacteriales bacterium]